MQRPHIEPPYKARNVRRTLEAALRRQEVLEIERWLAGSEDRARRCLEEHRERIQIMGQLFAGAFAAHATEEPRPGLLKRLINWLRWG